MSTVIALGLVGVKDDRDTAIGHLQWVFFVWTKNAAGAVDSNNGLRSVFKAISC